MKHISYQDKDGRHITKKEGFSWPTFWLLFIFGFIICGVIYVIVKLPFIMARGTYRGGKRIVNNSIEPKKSEEQAKE